MLSDLKMEVTMNLDHHLINRFDSWLHIRLQTEDNSRIKQSDLSSTHSTCPYKIGRLQFLRGIEAINDANYNSYSVNSCGKKP